MSRKHFEAIAAAIKVSFDDAQTREAKLAVATTAIKIANVCSDHNSNFDFVRLIKACGTNAIIG